MRFPLLLLGMCMCLCVAAQNHIPDKRKIDFGRTDIVRQKQSGATAISVVVATPDSISIGYIHPLRGNETTHLIGDTAVSLWYNRAAAGRMKGGESVPGLWIIRDLFITTDTSGAIGFAHLKADLFRRSSRKKCRLWAGVDTVFSFPVRDTLAFSGALDTSMEIICKSWSGVSVKSNEIFEQSEDSLMQAMLLPDKAVWKDKAIAKGIYLTYQDFLNNIPSVTDPFWVEADTLSVNGAVKIKVMGSDSLVRDVKDMWGICFGGFELYKYESGQLIPIEKAGRHFIVSRYQEPLLRRNHALVWRRVINYGWPDDANPYERKRSVVMKNSAAKIYTGPLPVATRVDPASGVLTF